jgi:predicted RNA-binding protein with PUA-like domain
VTVCCSTTRAAPARHRRSGPRGLGRAPDPTQFDAASPYFDPKSPPTAPRWLLLDVQALQKTRVIGLAELRAQPELADMAVLQRGNRLSITEVTPGQWAFIESHLLSAA